MSQIDGYIEKNIPSRWKNVGGDMITGWLLWNEREYEKISVNKILL